MILMILTVKTLVTLRGVTFHYVWPLKVWLSFYLLKDLMNRLLEHYTNHLHTRIPNLSSKIPHGSIFIISLRHEISLVKRSNLCLPFPLLLIIFDPIVLVKWIHKLAHALRRFHCQGLSQIMLDGEANFKRPY